MKYFLIFLVLFNIALFPKEKKSIYVYKILTKNTKDPNFESKFRNKMTEILLKDFSDYNLMDDDSIAGLKAKLEKSKMFGCNEEACMREISRSLNADEVITGSIEENNGKFKYSFKNSARVKKGEENLSIKSLSDGEFYLNQWEYFTGEIVRKLMNPSYTMNYKDAPLFENLDDFNYTTVKDLKEIKLPEIKGNTLDIVKRLKEVTIADADTAYQKKDYLLSLNGFRDARDALNSLSPEDKIKAGNMATDIQNRIYMVGDAMYAERLGELEMYYKENSPMSLKAVKKSKGLDGWLYLFTDYSKTLEEGERNPVTEKRIAKRSVELAERRYRLLMEEEEKSGDEKLALGKYDSAISYYEDALDIIKNSQGILGEKESSSLAKKLADAKAGRWNPEMDKQYAEIEKKSEELWKDGEYADYIEYLREKVSKLEELKAKGGNKVELISNTTAKVNQYPERLKAEEKSISNKISLYSDAAKVDESYIKKLEREKEKDTFLKKEIFEKELPASFTTKSGIKFTKILKKDGKPVYVSDRIRPNKVDSWYFARDYAEKLNKEENCPDCYRLPYVDEIVNLKAEPGKWRDGSSQEYEGLWLKSWSPAWLGMTMGNIMLGFYTFDFIHDVIFHPITWQSYVYPISPDGVYASRGGSWDSDDRFIRSASRLNNGGSDSDGFRLVRPLR